LKIYSDGASRGNPGPSAIAFIVLTDDNQILKRYAKFVGTKTNNQAEYEALIAALQYAHKSFLQKVICHLDSELVVKHLNREYKVKNPELKSLWAKVQKLKQNFQKISFVHVARTDVHIQEVDLLANQILDRVSYTP
jgi:ribonuclease HI